MALTPSCAVQVAFGDQSVTANTSLSGEGSNNRDVVAALSATTEVIMTFLFAGLQMILITVDGDLTLKTNSSGSPDETLALKSGIPFFWQKNSGVVNPFSHDCTKFYFVNAAGVNVNVKIRTLFDATP